MTSAVLVGGSPPPTTRILPSAYITADPESRKRPQIPHSGSSPRPKLQVPTHDQAPVPEVSRIWLDQVGPALKTLPSGTRNIIGYDSRPSCALVRLRHVPVAV